MELKKKTVIFFLVIVLFFSCRETKDDIEQKIIGDWQMVNFSTNQIINNKEQYRKVATQMIMSTSLIINSNGTIKSIIWGTMEQGFWQVKNNFLVVYDQNKRERFRAQILKVTDTQLLLFQKVDNVKVLLYFRKIN